MPERVAIGICIAIVTFAGFLSADAMRFGRSVLFFTPALFLLLAAGGFVGRFFGVHNLFRDDASVFGKPAVKPAHFWGVSRLLASPAFWSGAGFAGLVHYALFITYAAMPSECSNAETNPICGRLLFLVAGTPSAQAVWGWWPYRVVLLGLLLAFARLSLAELRRPLATLNYRKSAAIRWETGRVVLGFAAGTGFAWAVYAWSISGGVGSRGIFVDLRAIVRKLTASLVWDDLHFAFKVGIVLLAAAALTWVLRAWRDARESATSRPGKGVWIGVFGVLAGTLILLGLYLLADFGADEPHPSRALVDRLGLQRAGGNSLRSPILAAMRGDGGSWRDPDVGRPARPATGACRY